MTVLIKVDEPIRLTSSDILSVPPCLRVSVVKSSKARVGFIHGLENETIRDD